MPEVVERQNPQPPTAPSAAPVAGGLIGRLPVLAVALMAFSWGATVYFIPSREGRLWEPLAHAGTVPVRPILVASVLVAAVIGFVTLRKFKARFSFYKPVQARGVRTAAYVSIAAMVLFGCVAFYRLPPTTSLWWGDLWKFDVVGKTMVIKPILFPSAGIFASVLLAAHLMLNRASWAEFLIETEGELKKVYWPPRKEYVGSSVVVVVVVVVVAGFLFFADRGLSTLMHVMGIGF